MYTSEVFEQMRMLEVDWMSVVDQWAHASTDSYITEFAIDIYASHGLACDVILTADQILKFVCEELTHGYQDVGGIESSKNPHW